MIISSWQSDYLSLARARRMCELLRTAALSPEAAARELEIDELTMRGYCSGKPVPRYVTLAIERLAQSRSVKVYHIAKSEDASDILQNGFRDGTDAFTAGSAHSGVRIANRLLVHLSQLDPSEMACFQIKVSKEWLIQYEYGDKVKPYREFLVPAFELNDFPRRRIPNKEWLSMPWSG